MTGIVICANGQWALTRACLDSLYAHTRDFRLFLFEGVPWEDLSRTWNTGCELAWRTGCDWVVVSNNDVVFTPEWLPPLLDDRFFAVGPHSDNPGPAEVYPAQRAPQADADTYMRKPKPGEGHLHGFCFAVPTAHWDAVRFNECQHPNLGNEDDFFSRGVKRTNKLCGVAPRSFVHHVGRGTRDA